MLAGRCLAAPAAQPAVLEHCRRLHHARLKLIVPQRALAAGSPAFSPPAAAARAAALPGPPVPRPSKTSPRPWRCGAVQQLSSAAVDAAAGRLAAAAAPGRVIGPGEVHLWWLDPKKVGGVAGGAIRPGVALRRPGVVRPSQRRHRLHACAGRRRRGAGPLRRAAHRGGAAVLRHSRGGGRPAGARAGARPRQVRAGIAAGLAAPRGAHCLSAAGVLPAGHVVMHLRGKLLPLPQLNIASVPPPWLPPQVCAGRVPPRLPTSPLPGLWPQPARQACAAGPPHHRRRPPPALQPHPHRRHDWAGGHRWADRV